MKATHRAIIQTLHLPDSSQILSSVIIRYHPLSSVIILSSIIICALNGIIGLSPRTNPKTAWTTAIRSIIALELRKPDAYNYSKTQLSSGDFTYSDSYHPSYHLSYHPSFTFTLHLSSELSSELSSGFTCTLQLSH